MDGTRETISVLKCKVDSVCDKYEEAIEEYNDVCETITFTELYKLAKDCKEENERLNKNIGQVE